MPNAHKDSKNKFLPLVCGVYLKSFSTKTYYGHTPCQKQPQRCGITTPPDAAKSCIITKVITLIHHILPPGSSHRPQKYLNRIKGPLLRQTITKSCNVNHLKNWEDKGKHRIPSNDTSEAKIKTIWDRWALSLSNVGFATTTMKIP